MAQRAGVSFELERLDLEGDELVVSGHWSGVRGLRFVRPTLVAENRRILATLEHKPWAPSMDRTWTAAFPWEGDEIDVGGLTLAVGSQVTVPLDGEPVRAPEPEPAPAPVPAKVTPIRPSKAARPEPEPETPRSSASAAPPANSSELAQQLEADTHERDALARRLEDAERMASERQRRVTDEATATFDELTRGRATAERDRDRALAQLDEAVADRESAVRTRARMQIVHDEAIEARESAEAQLAATKAQRDEANAQRDEVLLAYRGLQRHVKSERARDDRVDGEEPESGDDPDAPIGVRTMPAARTVMAELQRPTKSVGRLPFSIFDLWVMRVLGTVAAGCFILLLVSILRVFL
jgi:hypothetical protein